MSKSVPAITIRRNPATIAALIDTVAPGTYASVVYIKADGTLRRQTFQTGNDARYCANTELGARMSQSFHANRANTYKLRRRDVGLMAEYIRTCARDGVDPDPVELRKFWRTIDCSRVVSIRRNGVTIRFAD